MIWGLILKKRIIRSDQLASPPLKRKEDQNDRVIYVSSFKQTRTSSIPCQTIFKRFSGWSSDRSGHCHSQKTSSHGMPSYVRPYAGSQFWKGFLRTHSS